MAILIFTQISINCNCLQQTHQKIKQIKIHLFGILFSRLLQTGMSELAPYWVRLGTHGVNRGILNISFQYILARRVYDAVTVTAEIIK